MAINSVVSTLADQAYIRELERVLNGLIEQNERQRLDIIALQKAAGSQ